MDAPAHEWRAVAATYYPKSDPQPGGEISDAPNWPQKPWQELAQRALCDKGGPGGLGAPGHLTLLDSEGYPLSIRARSISAIDGGFRLVMPSGAPWIEGKATLSFGGIEVFVGEVRVQGGATLMVVERALPILPIADQPLQVLQPTPETKAQLMKRLEHETRRRRQAIPNTPLHPPTATQGAMLRLSAARILMEQMSKLTKEGLR